MKKNEMDKFIEKARILTDWFDENIEEHHRPSISMILLLLSELEMVEVEEE